MDTLLSSARSSMKDRKGRERLVQVLGWTWELEESGSMHSAIFFLSFVCLFVCCFFFFSPLYF